MTWLQHIISSEEKIPGIKGSLEAGKEPYCKSMARSSSRQFRLGAKLMLLVMSRIGLWSKPPREAEDLLLVSQNRDWVFWEGMLCSSIFPFCPLTNLITDVIRVRIQMQRYISWNEAKPLLRNLFQVQADSAYRTNIKKWLTFKKLSSYRSTTWVNLEDWPPDSNAGLTSIKVRRRILLLRLLLSKQGGRKLGPCNC